MTEDRWTRIERIYHAALEQPVCDRAAFVRGEADGDVELIAEVEALLAYDERPAAFMDHSAMELAARAPRRAADRREPEDIQARSARTKSCARSAPAAWGTCTSRATAGSRARSH